MIKLLNSTGSFYQDENKNYWSYNTQLTCCFNGYRLVNKTYYSITTRKHQAMINRQDNDVEIINWKHGYIQPELDLKNYLQYLQCQLNYFKSKRNSKHKQARIDKYQKQIDLIEKVLNQ